MNLNECDRKYDWHILFQKSLLDDIKQVKPNYLFFENVLLIISTYLHSIIVVRDSRWSKRTLNIYVQPSSFAVSGVVLQRFGFWNRFSNPVKRMEFCRMYCGVLCR